MDRSMLSQPITRDERSGYVRDDVRTEMRDVQRRPREEVLADPKVPNIMKQVMRCSLDEAEEELTNRVHQAGFDNINNRQVINALSDTVAVTGKNGETVVMNNWANLAAVRRWDQKQKETMSPISHMNSSTVPVTKQDEDVEWDD